MAHEAKITAQSTEDRIRGYAPPPRHLAAIAASIAAHALILCAIVFLAARAAPQGHRWVLAYVIDLGAAHGAGGNSSGSLPARLDPAPASPPEAAIALPRAPHRARRSHRMLAALTPPTRPFETDSISRAADEPASTATESSSSTNHSEAAGVITNRSGPDNGAGGQGGARDAGAGSAAGSGDGSAGITIARADYGSDPAPLYPSRSRRRGEQGTVTLHVLIAASGKVERVELLASSGFRDLDDTALDTVRSRWRFVPARRDGIAFESWAIVPIRFALTEASN